jgi:hypothetical protein
MQPGWAAEHGDGREPGSEPTIKERDAIVNNRQSATAAVSLESG